MFGTCFVRTNASPFDGHEPAFSVPSQNSSASLLSSAVALQDGSAQVKDLSVRCSREISHRRWPRVAVSVLAKVSRCRCHQPLSLFDLGFALAEPSAEMISRHFEFALHCSS